MRRLAVSHVAKVSKEAKVAKVSQDTKTKELLVRILQANQAKEIEESSTPEPKKAEIGEVLVKTTPAGPPGTASKTRRNPPLLR